jgi:alkaline phosphatase
MRRISARPAIALLALAAAALTPVGASAAGPARASSTPKNVIVFIVDGMGPEQIALARAMKGSALFIDGIPWGTKGTLDTDSLEGVTDSAAGAVALASGVETNNGWLGMVPTSDGGARSVPTALELAESVGKATGLVSDSYITDATPAAFSAHVTSRSETEKIARQTARQGIEFLFGGGRRQGSVGPLLDRAGVTYVRNTREMNAYVANGGAGPVYGFFGSWNMAFNLDRDDEGVTRTEPTLPQMTSAALSVLSKDQDGFFLMVEGGLVDWGGHARDAASMGSEMLETDEAVKVAYDWADGRSDTLIVFTADHETGGFDLTGSTDVAAIGRQNATTEYMWGLIKDGAPVAGTLRTYARIDPTSAEVATVRACGEHGISDVLASRYRVSWNGTCTQEGDHTSTFVPVWAWGPGHAAYAGSGSENELVGRTLLGYYGG